MDLAKIAVKLRPRSPWEGVDLGFMVAREWFLPLWLLWMSSALPMMLLLALLPLPFWLKMLLLLWFKPLYEPLLLHWLGGRLFGDGQNWRALRAAWPKVVLPQLFANLTWRRLNPARSFVMPVSVLEHLRGHQRSERIRVLSRKSNAASWLTIIGFHIEWIFQVGFFLLLAMAIPQELLSNLWENYLYAPESLHEWVELSVYLLAMSMMAPFYVAGGFALYLTRRSELEGWDIELGLRRMAQRHAGKVVSWGALLVVCATLSVAVPATPLQAAEIDRQQVRTAIKEVLADETFGRTKASTRWKYIGESPDDSAEEKNPLFKLLESMAQGIASFAELLLWLGGGALLAYLIYWFATNRELGRGGLKVSGNGRVAPTRIAGLDLRPESLPDDPASEAERLIEAGDYRAALSLLSQHWFTATLWRSTTAPPRVNASGW